MNNIDLSAVPTPPSLEGIFGWIALTILGLSGVLLVGEAVGFIPERMTRWINRNRLAQTVTILEGFGIDVARARKRNRAASLDQTPGRTVEARVKNILTKFALKGEVTIGRTFRQTGEQFHDLMGATANFSNALLLARDLSAKWREVLSDPANAVDDRFDFVATPKSGSPLLGSAFAQLSAVPLALHAGEAKFDSDKHRFHALFDCDIVPAQGARAIVVDDSSTGGGKVIRLVEDLRALGYKVDDVLVVFEPQLKVTAGQNAAGRLIPLGVRLHSIVKT